MLPLPIKFYLEVIRTKSRASTSDFTTCVYGNDVVKFWAAYGEKFCGTMGVYDERRAKCCNSRKIVQKDTVCGGRKYDQCTQICCDGKIHQKDKGTTCCGQNTYNAKIQICCNNSPAPKFKCEEGWYWGRSYFTYMEAVCYSDYITDLNMAKAVLVSLTACS